MSSLKATITEAMKNAMRAQEKSRLETIRLIQASIKQIEVDQGKRDAGLTDDEILVVLDKMQKQRRDSIDQFLAGNRPDLAEKEKAEMLIIQEFLPQALTEAEVETLIKKAMSVTSAKTMSDMGKLMAELKPKLQGRTDMSNVSAKIKQLLSAN